MALFGGVLGGIIIAIAGAGLLAVSPWLGGLLIASGYGFSCYYLSQTKSRWEKSLCFGFGISALLGLLITIGQLLFDTTTNDIIEAMANRALLFVTFAFIPWPIALVKYLACLRFNRSILGNHAASLNNKTPRL